VNVLSAAKVTVADLRNRKAHGPRVAMLTAYDCPTARLQDEAGADIVFVGDSVGTNVLGYRSPQQVTMADMLHHTRAVRRGVDRAFLLADMPFLSYQVAVPAAVTNAGRLIQEAEAEGVKLEGGSEVLAQTRAIVQAGIPVMGHIGYTPQTQSPELFVHSERRGTVPKFQAKGVRGALHLLDEARRLEDAGAFALVLEMVTEEAAQAVTERLSIPTIGIGAGRFCDGQVLTVTDLLGVNPQPLRLAKAYADLRPAMANAFRAYVDDVRTGAFPTADHAQQMEPEQRLRLAQALREAGDGGDGMSGPA
jgi:3-methyl-2-oxobutanoate hydroxymethyltransferase